MRMGIVGVVAMGLLYLLIIENPPPTRPLVDIGLIWTRAVQIGVLRVARAAKL